MSLTMSSRTVLFAALLAIALPATAQQQINPATQVRGVSGAPTGTGGLVLSNSPAITTPTISGGATLDNPSNSFLTHLQSGVPGANVTLTLPPTTGTLASTAPCVGATPSVAGVPGLVPSAPAGQQGYFLNGACQWASNSGIYDPTNVSISGGAVFGVGFNATDVYQTEDYLTAHAGGGQSSATLLASAKSYHRFTLCGSAGDSGKLPPSVAGASHFVGNTCAVPIQMFGSGIDTINGVATGTGISQGARSGVWYVCVTAGNWVTTDTATIGTANQVNVTRADAGYITLSTPQDIATTSSPTFAGLMLTGLVTTNATALVPLAPTVTPVGTAGSTSYSYGVVAVNAVGRSVGSTITTIVNGNATLNGTNYNALSGYAVAGATSYQIWRTASNGVPNTYGLIAVTSATSLNDTGLAADGERYTNWWQFPVIDTSVGMSLSGSLQVSGSLAFDYNAGNYSSSSRRPSINFVVDPSGNQDARTIVWQNLAGIGGDGAYGTIAYFLGTGAFYSGAYVVISNKRANVNGDIVACGTPSMICVSPDVNGPGVGVESKSDLSSPLQSSFAAYDMNDVHGSGSAWSAGYGKMKWVVLGDGSQLWGTYLDNTTIAANADLQLYRIAAGKAGLSNSATKGPTGELDLGDIVVANQKSTTGQRYICIDTNGKLVSSASACSGT